jgi:hypothetical protein
MNTIRVKDSADNEYNLPETKLEDFNRLDKAIVETYDSMLLSMTDDHFELCEEWSKKFDRYMI